MDDLVTIPGTIAGSITAEVAVYADPTERSIKVAIGGHVMVLDLDTAKDLRDKLKIAIGSEE